MEKSGMQVDRPRVTQDDAERGKIKAEAQEIAVAHAEIDAGLGLDHDVLEILLDEIEAGQEPSQAVVRL